MNVKVVYFSYLNAPVTGLTPVWLSLKKASTNADVTPQPEIAEMGGGFYKYTAVVPLGEQWCGVIDGGIANLDVRNVPVTLSFGSGLDMIVTPIYDEVADSLQFIVFALVDGEVYTDLTSASIEVFDSTHTSKFTVSSSAPVGGVIVISKSTPALSAMEGYYCVATMTISGVVHVGVETMVTFN